MFLFVIIFFGIFLSLVWIGAIVDIVRSEYRDNNEKVLWILLVVLLPFIGTILYMVMGRTNKIS